MWAAGLGTGQRPNRVPDSPVLFGDVGSGSERVGVIGAQDPLLVGQQVPEQGQRPATSPHRPVQ